MSIAANAVPAGRWIDGLSADLPLPDALEVIFRQRWYGVLYYLPLAAAGAEEHVENVHKLRVSSRRLAAVLDVLADGFPAEPRKVLFRLVERIRRSCGKARDLDVRRQFLESLLPHASVEDAGAIELLCEQAVERRSEVQKKLRRRLPRLERKLIRSGNEMLAALTSNQRRAEADDPSFGAVGVSALLRETSALWSRAEDDLESAATLHELRIACKHLRYAFEIFMPMLDDSFSHDFYPQLEHLQDLLGEMHDAAQATRSVRRRRRKWKRRWKDRGPDLGGRSALRWRELRSGFNAVLLAYAQQADQARVEFLDLWPGFAGESFRVPVEEMLMQRAGSLSSGEAP
ncbi:MAG TPA: CHAD domain-containing protein [Planctomycetaceae bacterium]|jgi:CHAD domain-containing protein|nr:CHAD domain-containing protein [Planctomycetaceae bacterium]